MIRTLQIFAIILLSNQLFSQKLLPFVGNYNKSDYKGENQIWNVEQGKDSAIYFANNRFLLRFDGIKWEKYILPNNTVIRSLMSDGERIYSGSYKEFGYWHRKNGLMNYVSLTANTKTFSNNENEEIWKIFKFNGKIYFQSFNGIYIYDGKKISKLKLPFSISYCFVIDNQILIPSVDKGIYRLENKKPVIINGWDVIKNKVVHSIQQYQDEIYIFTKKDGVFIGKYGKLRQWSNSLNETLKSAMINDALFVEKDKLVIGTASNGVYIIDMKEMSVVNISKSNILMNNSILNICQDNERNLWLGLDNGIAYLEINSPLSVFCDNSGGLGSVYAVVPLYNGYLMASNHGLFKYTNEILNYVPNTQGQIWNISKLEENKEYKYLIGHNDGNYVYSNGKIDKINDIGGGWDFVKSYVDNIYIQGTYSGIIVYTNPNDLSKFKKLEGFVKPIRKVCQNKKNEIWAVDNNKGLYRIILDNDYNIKKVENITTRNKITNDFCIKMFEFRNTILFYIDNTWFTYNYINSKLEKSELFNLNFKDITDIVYIDDSQFLIFKNEQLYHISIKENIFVWKIIDDKYYKGKIIKNDLKIFNTKERCLLNLDDGFLSINFNFKNDNLNKPKIEVFSDGVLINNNSDIKHESELQMHIISGFYGIKKPNLYYTIDSVKNFIPIQNGIITLKKLSSGSHKINIYTSAVASYNKISSFNFYVNNPWYFSFWMIVLYLSVVSFILYLYYKWNKTRYLHKLKLHEENFKHQSRVMEMEIEAKKEIEEQDYKQRILELSLQAKSSEVAGKSFSIAKQTQMIEDIQKVINENSDVEKIKTKISDIIKINSASKKEWKSFETNLNQANDEFIQRLTQKYPNLTPKDIKLCVYLKMNLSSKEIAPMMNISFKGVELHRYRLRKKLNLSTEENIIKFLIAI